MQIYHDVDADLSLLTGRQIAVVGYGNQGRAQALNLRDSGLDVIVGNRQDEYADRARLDGFAVLPIAQAAKLASIVLLLIPDEAMPDVFEVEIAPHLNAGDALVFASGYAITYDLLVPPSHVDVVLVAPRMIGAGVRDLYQSGRGFPAFFAVAQDHSGKARPLALALAKGIGATRMGVTEVSFAQETELDLFTEQCFGPAFGQVLTTAVDLLLESGYPPEAILLELYMSGEFAYTLNKIAEVGLIEQSAFHSQASQYGSMSRGMRFILPELRARMQAGLDDIRSGAFAQEWAAEQAAGAHSLELLRESARSLPLYQLEQELRAALGNASPKRTRPFERPPTTPTETEPRAPGKGLGRALGWLRASHQQPDSVIQPEPSSALSGSELKQILTKFLERASRDPALRAFARGRQLTVHYRVHDPDIDFFMNFSQGTVAGSVDLPESSDVQLSMTATLLDGMLSGRTNALRAAMSGQLVFSGDTRAALAQQQIQNDLIRLYTDVRRESFPIGQ